MADVWANSMACHPKATCHIAGCSHLEKSMSGDYRIVSDTLVFIVLRRYHIGLLSDNDVLQLLSITDKTALDVHSAHTPWCQIQAIISPHNVTVNNKF